MSFNTIDRVSLRSPYTLDADACPLERVASKCKFNSNRPCLSPPTPTAVDSRVPSTPAFTFRSRFSASRGKHARVSARRPPSARSTRAMFETYPGNRTSANRVERGTTTASRRRGVAMALPGSPSDVSAAAASRVDIRATKNEDWIAKRGRYDCASNTDGSND